MIWLELRENVGVGKGRYTAKSDMLMVGQDVGQNVLLISSR